MCGCLYLKLYDAKYDLGFSMLHHAAQGHLLVSLFVAYVLDFVLVWLLCDAWCGICFLLCVHDKKENQR